MKQMTFSDSQIANVAEMTDDNDHSGVLVFIARCLNHIGQTETTQVLHDNLEDIAMAHELVSYLTPSIKAQREAWTSVLKVELFKHVPNAENVWMAL